MKIFLHQTHDSIGDFPRYLERIESVLKEQSNPGLHLFAELFLCGYPLQDLCLKKSFIVQYQALLENINKLSKQQSKATDKTLLMGGLEYQLSNDSLPIKIHNVVYRLTPGFCLEVVYRKRLLPNYDIFDEQKYFTPGNQQSIIEFQGKQIALLICEDMWPSNFHGLDPAKELLEQLQSQDLYLDLIVNLSASPYHLNKDQKRLIRAQHLAKNLQAPFVYLNRVGAEDEVLFDGQSFLMTETGLIHQSQAYSDCLDIVELPPKKEPMPWSKHHFIKENQENTWEGLFTPHLRYQDNHPPQLTDWTEKHLQMLEESLCFALKDYASKNGFHHYLVALSGGIDSALVLALAYLSLRDGEKLEALFMPSTFTSTQSYDLSFEMSQRLKIPLKVLPIKFLHSTAKNFYTQCFKEPFEGLVDENIQSRLRGMLLYTRSNQSGAMVLNTSNKSELSVGYTTQYGDSVGAISLLADLYKTEVYQLAHYLNKKYQLIPQGILEREPTAELRSEQLDQQTLPPYQRLDAILEGLLSHRYTPKDLVELGFESSEINKVLHLYHKSEFKRQQFCPIVKVKTKSFGFGYRIPISKSIHIYPHL